MMSHCWECGSALTEKFLENEGMVPFCPACNAYRFPIFNAAVSMLVICPEEKKLLLIQQYGRPSWILVAGYINKGETAEHAVHRELMEEVALKASRIVFNQSEYYPNSNTLIFNFAVFVAPGQEICITKEVDRWQWFSYEEAVQNVRKGGLAEVFLGSWLEKNPSMMNPAEAFL